MPNKGTAGIVLIVLTFVLPGGVVAGVRQLKARFIRIVPRPPVIPGLAADTGSGTGPATVVTDSEPAEATS